MHLSRHKKYPLGCALGSTPCPATDAGVELLKDMPWLESVHLDSSVLDHKVWSTLGRLRKLNSLTV